MLEGTRLHFCLRAEIKVSLCQVTASNARLQSLHKNRRKSPFLRNAAFLLWTLPRAKNCSPALNFYTSVCTGVALSSPQHSKKSDTLSGIGFFGTLEGTRTPDLLVRSQSLYPTELPAHTTLNALAYNSTPIYKMQALF